MTFKIFNPTTKNIVHQSNVCPGDLEYNLFTGSNLHSDPLNRLSVTSNTSPSDLLGGENTVTGNGLPSDLLGREKANPIVKSSSDSTHGKSKDHCMQVIDPEKIVGRSFLLEPHEDGQCLCACIVRAIANHKDRLSQQPEDSKFLCSINDDQYEKIVS